MVHFASILTRLGSSQGPVAIRLKACKKLRRPCQLFLFKLEKLLWVSGGRHVPPVPPMDPPLYLSMVLVCTYIFKVLFMNY